MKHRVLLLGLVLQAATVFAIEEKELPEKYRVWLTEEVPYIITPTERQVFLTLSNDKDREFFMAAFWAQRDPTPGTPTNEFKDEHYRRIAYANTYFIDAPMKGWRTDRGRIYIILGPPKTVERFEETLSTNPVEAWFYLGKTELGFPSGFNVMFIRKHGIGEYKLYHPGSDGPAAIMRAYRGDYTNREKVYEELKQIDAVLAEYSLSLLLGAREDRLGAAISSEMLLKNIATYPFKLIDPKYAEKITKYKTQIETDYSLSYVECRYMTRLTRAPSGMIFLSYAVVPKTLSIDQYEKTYYTSFKIYGKLEDESGRTVHEFTKNVPLEFDEATLNLVKSNSLCVTDMIPVVPGSYKFTLLVKNTVSKEFSDLEAHIVVPGRDAGLVLLEPVLSETIKPDAGGLRPFLLGDAAPELRPQATFLRGSSLTATFQTIGDAEGCSITAEIVKDATVIASSGKPLSEIARSGSYSLPLPTAEMPAGDYSVKFSLSRPGGAAAVSIQTLPFTISPAAGVPQPWVYSKVVPLDKAYVYDLIVADEYSRKGEDTAAYAAYEDGVTRFPAVSDFKIGFARLLLQKKDHERVVAMLAPLVPTDDIKTPEGFLYLATAQQATNRFAEAVENFSRYTAQHGTDYRILNAMGDCYLATGQKEQAIKIYKSSLEIYADQPALKSRLAQLGAGGR